MDRSVHMMTRLDWAALSGLSWSARYGDILLSGDVRRYSLCIQRWQYRGKRYRQVFNAVHGNHYCWEHGVPILAVFVFNSTTQSSWRIRTGVFSSFCILADHASEVLLLVSDEKCCVTRLLQKSNTPAGRHPREEGVAKSQVTVLSLCTGIVRNPSGRDSHLSGHSPPCEMDPVQAIYRMAAESVVVS